jgi:hypothetical protein
VTTVKIEDLTGVMSDDHDGPDDTEIGVPFFDRPNDEFQADVPQHEKAGGDRVDELHATVAAPVPPEAQFMTVAEVVQRAVNQANKFGEKSETRILLLNMARGMASIANNLDVSVG